MRTNPAWILATGLLAGLSGCALLFNFGGYSQDGDAGSGGGSGRSGSSSSGSGNSSSGIGGGQSSGSPSSASSGMCGQGSTSSGTGGSGSIQISGPLDDDVVGMDVDTIGRIIVAGTFKGSVNVGGVA